MRVILFFLFFCQSCFAFDKSTIRDWQSERTEGVVRQHHDYSCGASALATLINGQFQKKHTEQEMIAWLGKQDWINFSDMTIALEKKGYRALGLAISVEQLKSLKIPAIAHITLHNNPHFVVIRGISDD